MNNLLRRLRSTDMYRSGSARLREARAAALSGGAATAVRRSTGARFSLRGINANAANRLTPS